MITDPEQEQTPFNSTRGACEINNGIQSSWRRSSEHISFYDSVGCRIIMNVTDFRKLMAEQISEPDA